MSLSRVSSKGQIVIPKPIRERLGLKQGSRLKITMEQGRILLTPFTTPPSELLVEAKPDAVSKVLQRTKREDEKKLEALLRAVGITP